jgi:hypothetical protein
MMHRMRAPNGEQGSREPGWRRRGAPGVTGGLILILLGTLFLLAQMDKISWGSWWAYFLVGLGAIFLVTGIAGMAGRHGTGGRMIAGVVLIVIGGAHIIGVSVWWPYLLIGIGAALLISAFFRR